VDGGLRKVTRATKGDMGHESGRGPSKVTRPRKVTWAMRWRGPWKVTGGYEGDDGLW